MSGERERTGAPYPGQTVDLLPGEYLEQGVPIDVPARFTVELVGMVYAENGQRFVDAKGHLLRADGGTEPVPRYLTISLGPI